MRSSLRHDVSTKILERMRECRSVYSVVSSTATTAPFKPRGYASSAGRVDVIARCMFVLSLFPEEGACFIGVLLGPPEPPKVVLDFEPRYSSEREAAVGLSVALKRGGYGSILVSSVSPEYLLVEARRAGFKLTLMRENGVNVLLKPTLVEGKRFFVLGAQTDVPGELEALVESLGADVVSVGPLSLHTDHVILFVKWLRKRGAREPLL